MEPVIPKTPDKTTTAPSPENEIAQGESDDVSTPDLKVEVTTEKGDNDVAQEADLESSAGPIDVEREDLIFYQTNEKENSFFNALLGGFKSLKEAQETKSTPQFASDSSNDIKSASSRDSTDSMGGKQKLSPSRATVNFIDPTTKPPGASMNSPTANNLMSRTANRAPPAIEDVYEKLTYIFQRDYESTLRSVQYKNMRSGESDVISSIPVQTVLARAGASSGNADGANVAWGGMAGTAVTPVSDPAEWHNGPFCHVYIAACEGIDHYRTKVRPSLQAFVSQIQASNMPTVSSATTNSLLGNNVATPSNGSGTMAHLLIVYIPTGDESSSNPGSTGTSRSGSGVDDASKSSGPVRRALASQFAKARERIANYNQDSRDLDSSNHSKDSLGSAGDGGGMNDDPESMSAASLNLLSQNEQLLYKKMQKDFSSARVCVLSKSSLDKKDADARTDQSGIAVRTQEWNAFNRMLGSVIVSGFKDKCRRYNDELRRLDAQRAIAAQAAKTPTSSSSSVSTKFNLGYFFLVKESLAFTYEQMQLPAEALLQYDEFRAFLPDLDDKQYRRAVRRRRKSKALQKDEDGPSLFELADGGDFVGFRRKMRSEFDLTPILDIVRRYLFARELSLLFRMEQPVEVITRCEKFCKLMYSVMMRGFADLPREEQKVRKSQAAKWVVQFVWDVKATCDAYLLSVGDAGVENSGNLSVDTPASDMISESSQSKQSEQNVASRLGELLEMSRLMLKELGDTELVDGNPLRAYERTLPSDMANSWEPWQYTERDSEDNSGEASRFGRGGKTTTRQFLLENAFSSKEEFEKVYFDLASAIVNLSGYGHRRRMAFRLKTEMAEHLVRKGDLAGAAAIFKSTVKLYRWDQWDRCHFWRLFRLACCQRLTAAPTDYLKTLATCFGPQTSAHAPKKALLLLQDDLERVMKHDTIGDAKYGTIAFLETKMEILESSSQETTIGSGVDQKKLLKRFSAVGEPIRISVTVSNHLPRPITLTSLKLFIVDFATFSTILENRESVEEEDAYKIIGLDSNVELSPGKNCFTLEWEPSAAGQFVLSTLEMIWEKGYFYYDSMEFPAPLVGVDVVPSEPTQKLSMEPAYLVPGHDQEVKLTFDAGSDIVTAGKVEFSCSEGITMIGPGEDPVEGQWKENCQFRLKPCKPGETSTISVHVRCGLIERLGHDSITQVPSFDQSHGLKAKVLTTYLHSLAEGTDHSSTPNMKNVQEVFAPILEKTALSIDSVETLWLIPGERAMISVSLLSNTPDHFSMEDWNLQLPPPLQLVEGLDHNSELKNCSVSDGDQVSMAFECHVGVGPETDKNDDPVLQVKLKDDSGKIFTLDLVLDMNAFYLEVLESKLPKSSAEVKASLKLSAQEGPVGEPVKLSYTIETQAEGDIVYSISPGDSDWLVSGKINGSMQRSGFMSLGFMASSEVVGIPTAAGLLKNFPSIEVGIVSLQGGYTPLQVKYSQPDSFRSTSRTKEVGVAFASNKA